MEDNNLEYRIRHSCLERAALILFLVFLFYPAAGPCGNFPGVQQLKNELSVTPDGLEKIRISLSLAEKYFQELPDSTLYYLEIAQKLLHRFNSLSLLGRTFDIRGDLARSRNDFTEARRCYEIAVFCYRREEDKAQQLRLLNFIGSTYAQTGNISDAFKYYLKAREIAEDIKDTDMLARVNNNLGRIFISSQQYVTGIQYYQKALPVFRAKSDSFRMATVMMNLGTAYNHISKTDSSRFYSDQAIKIFRAINRKYYLGSSYQIYAFSLISEKKYEEALSYLDKTLKIATEPGKGNELIDSKLLLSDAMVFTGVTYFLLNDYRRAKSYLLKGYRLSDSLNVLERAEDALDFLTRVYEKTNQADSSLIVFKLFKDISDSLNKVQSINVVKLAEAQMEYEKDVKENKIQLAYTREIQRRNLALFLGSGAILLSFIIILFLRLRIENQKKKQIEIEKKHAELEKQAADMKLETQNKELAAKVMHSTRVNEMVLRIAEKLQQMEISENSLNGRIKSELIRELLSSTNKEDSWKEFEVRFQNVHTEFYNNLRNKFPNLTPNETRLCSFLRLNMTTKEISALTYQSERAIVLSRHRLRQKLGLDTSANLVTFLASL